MAAGLAPTWSGADDWEALASATAAALGDRGHGYPPLGEAAPAAGVLRCSWKSLLPDSVYWAQKIKPMSQALPDLRLECGWTD